MEEIISYFSEANFRLKTQQQVAKDFAQHGFHFSDAFSTDSLETDQIVNEVQARITDYLEAKKALLPLLYTIDIPEKKYKNWLIIESDNRIEKLTWMILEREAQKVYLREKFKTI